MRSTPSVRVTSRDLEVLDALVSFRFLSVPQAAELHFPSEGAAEARLRTLARARLVHQVFMPARPDSKATKTVYALARRGADLLRPRYDGERPAHVLERERHSALHLEHTLERNNVRMVLERLGERHPKFTLLAWTHRIPDVRGSAVINRKRSIIRVPTVPDGVATVRVGSGCEVLAIEVDRGTVPIARMLLRYRAYWQQWRDGTIRDRHGPVPFRVVTVTTSKARLEGLRRAAMAAPGGKQGSRLFWFGLLADLDFTRPERLLEPVFQTGKHNDNSSHRLFSALAPTLLCPLPRTPCDESSSTSTSDEAGSVPVAASSSADHTESPARSATATITATPSHVPAKPLG